MQKIFVLLSLLVMSSCGKQELADRNDRHDDHWDDHHHEDDRYDRDRDDRYRDDRDRDDRRPWW